MSGHPFPELQPEYQRRLQALRVTRPNQINVRAAQLAKPEILEHFEPVSRQTGIPIVWMLCSFEREASCDFRLSPAQGDPWDQVSRNVPRGVGPFGSWPEAAVWSYRHDEIDKNSFPWTTDYCCYAWEKFNGFGYRAHGRVSPYDFSGTDQYDPPEGRGGRYAGDGNWAPGQTDPQLGCVPLMLRITELRPELALPGPRPGPHSDILVPVTPPPVGVGGGIPGKDPLTGTMWVQDSLNRLMLPQSDHLRVDGNYGRFSRQAVRAYQASVGALVDGRIGEETCAYLDRDLSSLH